MCAAQSGRMFYLAGAESDVYDDAFFAQFNASRLCSGSSGSWAESRRPSFCLLAPRVPSNGTAMGYCGLP